MHLLFFNWFFCSNASKIDLSFKINLIFIVAVDSPVKQMLPVSKSGMLCIISSDGFPKFSCFGLPSFLKVFHLLLLHVYVYNPQIFTFNPWTLSTNNLYECLIKTVSYANTPELLQRSRLRMQNSPSRLIIVNTDFNGSDIIKLLNVIIVQTAGAYNIFFIADKW